jgi:NADH dehydrogenase
MKVVITGANGAVGHAILLRHGSGATDSPVELVAAVRSERAVKELPPLRDSQIARISYEDVSSLRAALGGASAVIHLAGLLVLPRGSTYEIANVETTRNVAEAARIGAVQKIVYVSAIGANAASSNGYWRSKGQAEGIVRGCGCAYTILRVPLLLGPRTEGAAALQRHLLRSVVLLPGGGRNLQQPLDVDDLAFAALRAADPSVAKNRALDLVGPVSLPDREIVQRAASLTGRAVRIRSIPVSLAKIVLAISQSMGRTGLSADVLEVITANTQQDPTPAATELGFQLTGLDEMLTRSLGEIRT